MAIKSKQFILRSGPLPKFPCVLQGWYSPVVGSFGEEDDNLSAMVTVGITHIDTTPRFKKDKPPKSELILLGASTYSLPDIMALKAQMEVNRQDYFNVSSKLILSDRNPTQVIIGRLKHKRNNPHLNFKNLSYLNLDRYDLESLDDLLTSVLPTLYQLQLTKKEDGKSLKPHDALLMTLLSSYPGRHAYSLTAALTTLLLYIDIHNLLNKRKRTGTPSLVEPVY